MLDLEDWQIGRWDDRRLGCVMCDVLAIPELSWCACAEHVAMFVDKSEPDTSRSCLRTAAMVCQLRNHSALLIALGPLRRPPHIYTMLVNKVVKFTSRATEFALVDNCSRDATCICYVM